MENKKILTGEGKKTVIFYIDTKNAPEDKVGYLNNIVTVMKNQNKELVDQWIKAGYDVFFFPVNSESSRIEVIEV